ncbi:very short patch repair endonuclease [Fulvivirga ulvae]|uniref:very short patch repair endonuclease n=1 Tax=Fulvivirga ulvae TaxID=2904245 RepID=UPI001F376DAB|nr:very short patch repair endonuclease [Fulvivirga ulvae]UII31111.1 very short patch repair endonuclease [Fulvivirga ulvae]
MADVHEPEVRSYNMSRIKGKNTKPEILVRKFLHAQGFRYGLHNRKLPGKPDLVLRKYKTVMFVHGCFWHGHKGCKYFVIPKTRTQWWIDKINKNKENDTKHVEKLKKSGWQVIIIWECELKRNERKETLDNLIETIKRT